MGPEHIMHWFEHGDMELTTAQHIFETQYPKPLNIICYLCQQSAEKYLKGYLIYHIGDEAPHTHSLTKLCALCAQWNTLFDEIHNLCNALNPYGVQPRYPDEIEIDDRLTKIALLNATEIKKFAPLQNLQNQLQEERSNENQ